jgi:hypothetical protein
MMSNIPFDPEVVREWVYQILRKPMDSNRPQMNTLLFGVYNLACQNKIIEPRWAAPNIPASPEFTDIPADLQNMIRALVWDLIIQGIIVPGIPNQLGGGGLPAFVVSDWGKKCLERGEYLTFDALKYLTRLEAEIPGFDGTAKLYLKDSLASFRTGAYP